MSTLIITEKPSVARRIANSLGNPESIKRNGIYYYKVGNNFVVPSVGHVFALREKGAGIWRYPVFDIDWVPIYKANKESKFAKDYIENIEFLARKCDKFINACDYDIEGEVIGYNIIRFLCKTDPLKRNVQRMKFSTLTRDSILNAYNNLEYTNKGMADAGITRHTLDWFWGINLSRALTIAVRRAKGYTTLSTGRVQGPALKILVTREEQIEKFIPEKYWEIEMISLKGKGKISSMHINGRFKKKESAEKIIKKCGKTAIVKEIKRTESRINAPHPFDLTTLQTEAYSKLGINPVDTQRIAQDLYTNAYISYPRTSSQQLPRDLNFKDILKKLSAMPEYRSESKLLLSKKTLRPNNGKKKDPAHPAIHPTGEIPKNVTGRNRAIYDLIVRRFMATFGDPAIMEKINVKLDNNDEIFVSDGTTLKKKNWMALYGKYAKVNEKYLPDLREDEKLRVKDINLLEKETQPPKRYTMASIIRELERRNLGTKATRSQIIDTLFKRGYLSGKSIEVTPLGKNVVNVLKKYCPDVLSEKLTREFEEGMRRIEEGKITSNRVIEKGKKIVTKICNEFKKNESMIGKELATSLRTTMRKKNKPLGKCLKCNGNLVMRKSKHDRKFIGCDNYPECTFTISLPKGRLKISEKCKHCNYLTITVQGMRPWKVCINPECPSKKQ